MDLEITLHVDGTARRLVVDTRTTLLDVVNHDLADHATGVRVRSLPIHADDLLEHLPG